MRRSSPPPSLSLALVLSPSFHPQGTPSDSKNGKKKNSKKTNKNKSSLSRANKKKPGMPNVANDLSQKLYASLEKHKEVRAPFIEPTSGLPVVWTPLPGTMVGMLPGAFTALVGWRTVVL